MIKSKWFKEEEFQRCIVPCSLQDMNQRAINMLDTARDFAGIPIVLNTAYRSPEYERKQGRAGTSAHTLGVAFDIRCHTNSNRFKLIVALLQVGFNRIGVYETFIHADCSQKHDQNVIWYG